MAAGVDLSVAIVDHRALLQSKIGAWHSNRRTRSRIDPFYRGLGSDQLGSGLGLSIVKAIADRTAPKFDWPSR